MQTHALPHASTAPLELTRDRRRTRLLLLAGAVGGPLFTTLALGQALTRDGFDLARQPLSLLSLGDLGWLQITDFVVTGALMVALALGMRRVLTEGTGRTWAPLLTALLGLGLVAGGVFLPDPALGYPPGTPDSIPSSFSWHGTLHAVAPPFAFTALVACCFVFVRRFAAGGRRAAALYSAATGVVALSLTAWPDQDGAGIRLAVAVFLGLAWTTFIALDLRRTA